MTEPRAGGARPSSPSPLAVLTALAAACIALGTGSLAPARAATTERPDHELRRILVAAIADAGSFVDRFDAEVWLVDMSGRLSRTLRDPNERLTVLRLVHQEATRARLAPELVLAVIQVESNFDRFAISVAGAQGLMQIMPFWLEEIGRPGDNLFQIRTNLRLGCTILRYYLDREGGGREGGGPHGGGIWNARPRATTAASDRVGIRDGYCAPCEDAGPPAK